VLYHAAFGYRDSANGLDMRRDTVMRIASMTKPITSVAVMMLVEEGRLQLDEPLSVYLPSYRDIGVVTEIDETSGTFRTRPPESAVTIRQMLSHTAGFGYPFCNPTLTLLQELTGKEPEEFPLLHDPGIRWTYSIGTRVLGRVVETISGAPLDAFVSHRVFEPLKMRDTFWAVPPGKHDRVATWHQRSGRRLSEVPNPDVLDNPAVGDSGLYSTALDYCKFLQMLLGGGIGPESRLLDTESVRAMTSNQIGSLVVQNQPGTDPLRSNAFPSGAGRDKFGLGVQIAVWGDADRDLRGPGSFSWSGLYNTHFWVDPSRSLIGILLQQVLPFYDAGCTRLLHDFEILVNQTVRPRAASPRPA